MFPNFRIVFCPRKPLPLPFVLKYKKEKQMSAVCRYACGFAHGANNMPENYNNYEPDDYDLEAEYEKYEENSEENYDPLDDYDICYECSGYGDDYSYDDNGNLICNCDACPFCPWTDEED